MIYAVYRILYGSDFIKESLYSILSYVDKIFIFLSDTPWGNVEKVEYKGEEYIIPKPIDNVSEILNSFKDNEKIKIIFDNASNNLNQFTKLVNTYILPFYSKPSRILFLEPDHVFRKDQIEKFLSYHFSIERLHVSSNQIELWKTYKYRIPERKRYGAILWDLELIKEIPSTLRHANISPDITIASDCYVHNFGFCINERTMFYKFLLTIGFSERIGDSEPNLEWFEKWRNWSLNNNNSNLEISKGVEYLIPHAIPYDNYVEELPETIVQKYSLLHT